jgi:hypothetical protein
MNRPRARLLSALALAWAGVAHAQQPPLDAPDTGWRLALHSDRHSDAMPLADLAADDPLAHLQPRAGRNLAYIDDELRISRRQAGWDWGLLVRQSATLATDHDTLELARQASGQTATNTDQRWRTHVRYRQFSGAGIELGHRFVLAEDWRAAFAVQGLQLRHWRERLIDGPVSYTGATGSYRFDLNSHQGDDRQNVPFQEPFAAHGAGLLMHGELAWQAEPWRLSLGVRDLGWLRWRGLPQQDLLLSTDTQSVDADGYVVYQPLVQGRNSQAGFTRAMSGWWTAKAAWSIDADRSVEASVESVRGFGVLPALAWQQRFGELGLTAQWRVHEQRATLGLAWRGLALRFGVDRLGGQAHSRTLALAYTTGW